MLSTRVIMIAIGRDNDEKTSTVPKALLTARFEIVADLCTASKTSTIELPHTDHRVLKLYTLSSNTGRIFSEPNAATHNDSLSLL